MEGPALAGPAALGLSPGSMVFLKPGLTAAGATHARGILASVLFSTVPSAPASPCSTLPRVAASTLDQVPDYKATL